MSAGWLSEARARSETWQRSIGVDWGSAAMASACANDLPRALDLIEELHAALADAAASLGQGLRAGLLRSWDEQTLYNARALLSRIEGEQ